MLSTKTFIKFKCTQDHLTKISLPKTKISSVYSSDFVSKKAMKKIEFQNAAHQQNMVKRSESIHHIGTFESVFRESFKNYGNEKPQKYKPKESFFLKTQSYEPIDSSYSSKYRTKSIGPQQMFKLQKGKAQTDCLPVAIGTKIQSKSSYKESYECNSKLPSLFEKKRISRRKSLLKVGGKLPIFIESKYLAKMR